MDDPEFQGLIAMTLSVGPTKLEPSQNFAFDSLAKNVILAGFFPLRLHVPNNVYVSVKPKV